MPDFVYEAFRVLVGETAKPAGGLSTSRLRYLCISAIGTIEKFVITI
jgi:hypothetical protein